MPPIKCSCPDETGFPHCTAPKCIRITPLLERMSFQDAITHLETAVCGVYVPGTMVNRVMLGEDIAASYGLGPSPDGSTKAWCLSLGKLNEPKRHFYGWNISEAVVRAWEEVIRGKAQA